LLAGAPGNLDGANAGKQLLRERLKVLGDMSSLDRVVECAAEVCEKVCERFRKMLPTLGRPRVIEDEEEIYSGAVCVCAPKWRGQVDQEVFERALEGAQVGGISNDLCVDISHQMLELRRDQFSIP
jgi:hypothetical protein